MLNWTSDRTAEALPQAKSKHTFLPLLIVLFLVSYSLMAFLVLEQARTIDAQRNLIRQLFGDSTELSSMKGKAFQKQRAQAQAQAEANGNAHSQAPATPPKNDPRDRARSEHHGRKLRKPAPPQPPQDASDVDDARRALVSI